MLVALLSLIFRCKRGREKREERTENRETRIERGNRGERRIEKNRGERREVRREVRGGLGYPGDSEDARFTPLSQLSVRTSDGTSHGSIIDTPVLLRDVALTHCVADVDKTVCPIDSRQRFEFGFVHHILGNVTFEPCMLQPCCGECSQTREATESRQYLGECYSGGSDMSYWSDIGVTVVSNRCYIGYRIV
jgi:hypothetical protein